MKKIFSFLKKNMDLVLIFIVSFFLSFPYLIDLCSGYLKYGYFDLQLFLLADHLRIKDSIIYKDLIYPFGLLQYYKSENILFIFLSYLIIPLLLSIIYFILKKIINSKYFLYVSFLFFYLFIFKLTGFITFGRYGILVAFSLLFSYVIFVQNKISKISLFTIGITLGLLFSLVNDQGIYLFWSFIFVFLANILIKNNKKILLSFSYYIIFFKQLMLLILGIFIGILPLFIYLGFHNSILGFIIHYQDINNVVVVSKTPFFNFITSKDNLFIILTLYVALFYFCIKYLFFKNKITLINFFQLNLIFNILILEQKSIIRSISSEITFIPFLLLIFLIYEFILRLRNNTINNMKVKILYLLLLTVIVFLFGLKSLNKPEFNFSNIYGSINLLTNDKCYDKNLQIFISQNPSLINVANKIVKKQGFNDKIYSFPPGEAIFYILLNQDPPYYNSIWAGSSIKSQNDDIEYIKKHKVKDIIININLSSIQDGVPDYIRVPLEFKYILNNYSPLEKIGDHLILKKNMNNDFFGSEILNKIPEYKDYLLNVYLYKIPYSEGIYKYDLLKKNSKLVKKIDSAKVNLSLEKNPLSSDNKVFVLIPSVNPLLSTINSVRFLANKEYFTTIYFSACKKAKPCIINLSNIPFFYKNRVIRSIEFDQKFQGLVEIYEIKKLDILW